MDALRSAALLADVSIYPYHAGQGVVDTVLFIVFWVLIGIALAWGMRIGNKLP